MSARIIRPGELEMEYPVPVWLAAEKVYDHVTGRHAGETDFQPFRSQPLETQARWLQGTFQALHTAAQSIGSTALSRLLRMTL